jgi:hypothetical protein
MPRLLHELAEDLRLEVLRLKSEKGGEISLYTQCVLFYLPRSRRCTTCSALTVLIPAILLELQSRRRLLVGEYVEGVYYPAVKL